MFNNLDSSMVGPMSQNKLKKKHVLRSIFKSSRYDKVKLTVHEQLSSSFCLSMVSYQ